MAVPFLTLLRSRPRVSVEVSFVSSIVCPFTCEERPCVNQSSQPNPLSGIPSRNSLGLLISVFARESRSFCSFFFHREMTPWAWWIFHKGLFFLLRSSLVTTMAGVRCTSLLLFLRRLRLPSSDLCLAGWLRFRCSKFFSFVSQPELLFFLGTMQSELPSAFILTPTRTVIACHRITALLPGLLLFLDEDCLPRLQLSLFVVFFSASCGESRALSISFSPHDSLPEIR